MKRRLMPIAWLIAAVMSLGASPPAQAQADTQAQAPATTSDTPAGDRILADPALEARARALMKEIRCVVCQSQSIDESEAGIAHDMRQIIRTQVEAGKSNQEIRDYLTERYGDFVLLKPPFKATTLVLWLGPFALIAFGGVGLYLLYRRPSAAAAAALSPAERERLAAFLKDGANDESAAGRQP